MQDEEAGPPGVVAGGGGAPSVRGGRGAAGSTAASCGAPARAPSALARAPVRPAPAPAPVIRIPRGGHSVRGPSRGACPLGGVARPDRRAGSSALAALILSESEEIYKNDVNVGSG